MVEVTKEHRQLSKAINFGLLYGQGARGLAKYAKTSYGVNLTEEEAKKHRRRFFKTYPDQLEWQQATGREAERTGKTRTVCGRGRDFNREVYGYRYTVSLNHPVQGSAGEVLLCLLKRLSPLLSTDCRLINSVHDEILCEVRSNEAERYLKLVE